MTGIAGTLCAQNSTLNSIDTLNSQLSTLNSIDTLNSQLSTLNSIDSIIRELEHSSSIFLNDSTATAIYNRTIVKEASTFKPNPKVAWIAASIFPGFGQIYNRQYWKLPIVYGGLMGCAYAVTWNNKTYQDYKTAYFDIMHDVKNDPNAQNPESWSQSWQDYVAANADPATRLRDRNFQDNLKRGKDYFRRYRDLSIIIGVGLYLIFVADSYVDAQMFDFDVSPDLSFRMTPVFIPETLTNSRCYGFNFCLTF